MWEEKELDDRAKDLLKKLVARYIREGVPVGSRTLAQDFALDISSATIRNVMAELERGGFLTSPHTSSGRVPTAKGYRFFVDSLLNVQPLDDAAVSALRGQLSLDGRDISMLIDTASKILSNITQLAGVVTLPKRDQLILRHVEFVPLSTRRVLTILVLNEYEVQNKVMDVAWDFSQADLEKMGNYLNDHFVGQDLLQSRKILLQELKEAQQDVNVFMSASLAMAERALVPADKSKDNYILAGQSNLFQAFDSNNVDKLRRMIDAFNHKSVILNLLDQSIQNDGLQIYIGSESGYPELEELSMVTAPYSAQGQVVGVLGVIGPTRMNYEKVIQVVDVTAKLLGAALNQE